LVKTFAGMGVAAELSRQSRRFCETHPPGTAYVYLNYGLYWLVNVLVGNGIVLLRALEPTQGIKVMQQRRNRDRLKDLCSGPGKLGQALGFSAIDHGADFTQGAFSTNVPLPVRQATRIGITKAADFPWRFLADGSLWISVK
jgi:DNA-3-methyladenine glycosylase